MPRSRKPDPEEAPTPEPRRGGFQPPPVVGYAADALAMTQLSWPGQRELVPGAFSKAREWLELEQNQAFRAEIEQEAVAEVARLTAAHLVRRAASVVKLLMDPPPAGASSPELTTAQREAAERSLQEKLLPWIGADAEEAKRLVLGFYRYTLSHYFLDLDLERLSPRAAPAESPLPVPASGSARWPSGSATWPGHFHEYVEVRIFEYLEHLSALHPDWPMFAPETLSVDELRELLGLDASDTRTTERVPGLAAALDPFANPNGLAAFASGPPALGAVRAILTARKGWPTDELGRPRYVFEFGGNGRVAGALAYHIVLPSDASGEEVANAQKELTAEIHRKYGTGTAALHLLLLVYAGQLNTAYPVVLPRQVIYQALHLDRRTDLSREAKDQLARAEIRKLQSLGLAILRLKIGGKALDYDQTLTNLWFLSVRESGQLRFESSADGGRTTLFTAEDWQLLARPGEWGDMFLSNSDHSVRMIGYIDREVFDVVDHREPWSLGLAALLSFRLRIGLQDEIRVAHREIVELDGSELIPADKRDKQGHMKRLISAIEQQRKRGFIPNYREWPPYLRPDLDASRADVLGDGSAATVGQRRPKGYWETLVNLGTWFTPPSKLVEANRKARPALSASPTRLPSAPTSPMSVVFGPQELKVLRQQLGFSQAELGQRLGVTDTAIRFMEQGKRTITPALQQKLAELPGHLEALTEQ